MGDADFLLSFLLLCGLHAACQGQDNSWGGGVANRAGGTGLQGDYFSDMNLTTFWFTRLDPYVDWSTDSMPDPRLPAQHQAFSARWTGFVVADYTETYTFYIGVDDGCRLWVNNQLVIDAWHDQVAEVSGQLAMTAGQAVPLKVEFYQNGGRWDCHLRWSSNSTPKAVIPTQSLFPPGSSGGGGGTGPTITTQPANVTMTAGQTATFTVAATGTGTLTYQWQMNGASISGATSATYSTATATNGATFDVIVTDSTGSTTSNTVTLTVNAGPPKSFTITGPGAPIVGGTAASFTATVLDASGNTVTGYTGTVHFSSSDIAASLPANYTFQAADNGVHSFTVTFNTVATQSLTVTDASNGTSRER